MSATPIIDGPITGDFSSPTIASASVKVMRSYDYCHFEIALSSNDCGSPEMVDDLRKRAARLADKAVEQYKIAKEQEEKREQNQRGYDYLRDQVERLQSKPVTEWTEREMAQVKAFGDAQHAKRIRRYDYEDNWNESPIDEDQDIVF